MGSSFDIAAVSQDASMSFDSPAEMVEGLTPQIEEARDKGASVIVFPEYGGLALAKDTPAEGAASFHVLQGMIDQYRSEWQRVAQQFHAHIAVPSLPVWDDGAFRNRTFFVSPNGKSDFQDKAMLTREEIGWGNMLPGNHNKVFDTKHGPIGIAICYDTEFPNLVAEQAKAGADIILAPSNVGNAQGNSRVEIGARNQALTHQVIVAKSNAVGISPTSAILGENYGNSAIYGPPDGGFPDDGIMASGTINKPNEVVVATVDRNLLADARLQGTVNNRADYSRQPHLPAQTVKLD